MASDWESIIRYDSEIEILLISIEKKFINIPIDIQCKAIEDGAWFHFLCVWNNESHFYTAFYCNEYAMVEAHFSWAEFCSYLTYILQHFIYIA